MANENLASWRWFKAASRDKRNIWLLLALLVLLLRWVGSYFPGAVESLYSRGVFLGIRLLLDYTLGWLPFPAVVLVVVLLIAWAIRRWRNRPPRPERPWLNHLHNLGTLVAAGFVLFNVLWGFNYGRVPIATQLSIPMDSLQTERLCEEMEWAARRAESERALIGASGQEGLAESYLPDDLETEVRTSLKATLRGMGYPAPGRVRARMIPPRGILLRLGISGIYNPFTGEANVAFGLTPQRIPSTVGHEMSHAFGFGDEGTCNFLGIMACLHSKVPIVRYSGLMSYWGYLANELAKLDPLLYKMLRLQLAPGLEADLIANRENYRRYHGWVSEVGEKVNDAYLKSQGVAAGTASYNEVVLLLAGWRAMRPEAFER